MKTVPVMLVVLFLASLIGFASVSKAATVDPDPPIECGPCEAWNEPHEPFRVFGNTYYVGTAGLTSVLITSDEGHVLIDGALPQSAPLIAGSIEALGFRLEDVRFILNSHAHFDHAGGTGALQRASGATVAASPWSAEALAEGAPGPEDPQFGLGREANAFPPVTVSRVIGDGEVLDVGGIALTARFTPGHTPGGTTWTWRSCEAGRCLDMVYGDSLTAVSAPGFRFTESGAGKALSRSIETVRELPCDVLLVTHPGGIDLEGKYQRAQAGSSTNPFVEPGVCAAYADLASRGLEQRLEEERAH